MLFHLIIFSSLSKVTLPSLLRAWDTYFSLSLATLNFVYIWRMIQQNKIAKCIYFFKNAFSVRNKIIVWNKTIYVSIFAIFKLSHSDYYLYGNNINFMSVWTQNMLFSSLFLIIFKIQQQHRKIYVCKLCMNKKINKKSLTLTPIGKK